MNQKQDLHTREIVDVATAKSHLGPWGKCREEHGGEPIRLLDEAQLLGIEWGRCLTLQIMEYGEYQWLPFKPKTRSVRSLRSWYSFIRNELQWTGRVIVGVAGGDDFGVEK